LDKDGKKKVKIISTKTIVVKNLVLDNEVKKSNRNGIGWWIWV